MYVDDHPVKDIGKHLCKLCNLLIYYVRIIVIAAKVPNICKQKYYLETKRGIMRWEIKLNNKNSLKMR